MRVEKTHELLPLEMLRAGEEGRIAEVMGEPARVHQLAEMGLHRDCRVRMICPGQPCVMSVEGRRFSLRLNVDISVLVNPLFDHPSG
jgi:ferrous iron transport protein A